MDHKLEKDWITKAGLRAVVNITTNMPKSPILHNFRCGYVGVPKGSSLHGLEYISMEYHENSDIDMSVDVHGGLTYSRDSPEYPAPSDGLWWFGFDCGHAYDEEDGGKSLEYVVNECESLAKQLVELGGE